MAFFDPFIGAQQSAFEAQREMSLAGLTGLGGVGLSGLGQGFISRNLYVGGHRILQDFSVKKDLQNFTDKWLEDIKI